MKTKRLMSIVLALAMICTMFGNLTAFAIDTPTEYKFIVNATNMSNESISGGTYTISYGDTVSNELNFGEENTVSILNQNTATLDLKTLPTGYLFEGGRSVNFTLGDSDLTAFTSAGMTATFDSETNLYTLGLMLQEQPILPSGSVTVTFKMKAQDAEGQEVLGVKYKVGDREETAADGTSEATVTFGGYAADSTLSITTVPEGYKKPETATFNTATLKTDFENAGYVATETSTGLDSCSVELTLTLEEDTTDDTTYTISIDDKYDDDNGKIEVQETAKAGEKVEINLKLNDGYDCSYVAIFNADNFAYYDSVEDYTTKDDGTLVYEMTMPEHNVLLYPYLYAIEYTYHIYCNQSIDSSELKYKVIVDTTEGEEKCFEKNKNGSNTNDAEIILPYSDKDKTVKFVITEVPSGYEIPEVFTFTCGENPDFDSAPANYTKIYDNDYRIWGITLMLDTAEEDDDNTETKSPFTVKAVVNSATTDVDADKEGTQVNAKDTVKVDVVVSGGDFTNADWEMIYDPTLFEYKSMTTNVDTTKGTVTTDDTKTAVLSGSLIANAGLSTGDEFADGTAIVTYEFTAKAQNADKVGTFKIESAHANNYVIAGTSDNKVANTENTTVEIVLVDNTEDKDEENGTVTVPAGTFTSAEKVYNAQKQTGNAFVLDEDFANAKVTYFANEDGSAVADTTELASKSFKTTLPSWKNVGEYTYYAKIYGDGLKTTYVSTTLTIKPAELIPSAMFKVDPDVNEVEFTPTLEGALDETHKGTVTVKYTDKDGEQTKTLEASDFKHDGETTSVYNGTIKTTAATSGEFTVTLTYNDGTNDNYTGSENTAKVNVDKITADKVTVDALEETITSVFGYDSKAHGVKVDEDAVAAIVKGNWKYTVSDEDATVTNVGEDKMVKVTFTDENGVYNDVIVYVILKVTPANVKITVDDYSKVMNEDDPELTGTVKVVDEDGNEVTGVTFNTNGLYGEDNLEVSYEREAGEDVGKYVITASYAPNDNYTVTIENGKFEITAPSTDDSDPDNPAKVKIEVVDHSYENDGTPDYTAGKRLILVYTDLDKLFYGYSATQSAEDAEKMFDVTAAYYKYTKYNYEEDGKVTATVDNTEYKHIYGIVVDKLDSEETGAELEALYKANVVFLSSDLKDAPENIVYDGDINLSNEIDVNDYSMTNGIYNNAYARETYIKNILKADIDGDKKVDTTDVLNVKQLFEAKNK